MTYPKGFNPPKPIPTHGTLPKGYVPPASSGGSPPKRYSQTRKGNDKDTGLKIIVFIITIIVIIVIIITGVQEAISNYNYNANRYSHGLTIDIRTDTINIWFLSFIPATLS